jgi:hypothetical protein
MNRISRKNRKNSRRANNRKNSRRANNRKNSRKNSRRANNRKNRTNRRNNRKQRGGMMEYGATQEAFGTMLESNLRDAAGVAPLDKANSDLSQFAGSYGTQTAQVGGRRRNSRKNGRKNRKNSRNNRKNSRKQRGGAFGDQFASVNAPANLLAKDMYPFTHQNPQIYNENIVNPNFHGPSNSYAAQ